MADTERELQFRTILKSLVTNASEDDGRIPLRVLANLMSPHFKFSNQTASLHNYLRGGDFPRADKIWWIGECLREAGITWCSGLWALWAADRKAAALTIIAATLRNAPEQAAERCEPISKMLWSARWLAESTPLDYEQPFMKYRITKLDFDLETRDALDSLAFARGKDYDEATAWTQHAFAQRERAKSQWIQFAAMAHDMYELGYKEWEQDKMFEGEEFSDRLLQSAIAISMSDMPSDDRELAVLTVVDQWLTLIEVGFNEPLPRINASDFRKLYETHGFVRRNEWLVQPKKPQA